MLLQFHADVFLASPVMHRRALRQDRNRGAIN